MKRIRTLAMTVLVALALTACGDYEYLHTEKVDTPPDAGVDDTVQVHELFKLAPGTEVFLHSLSGAIDPVGTTIQQDFDGDGILNDRETTSNIWVADYPVIETNIAAPVTMKIEVLYSNNTLTKDYSTDITSSDTMSNMEYSTEAVHRNEVNLRTVQFQDSFNWSDSKSVTKSKGGSAGLSLKGGGGSGGYNSSVTRSYSHSYGETKTKWKDVPFKNNLNRTGWSLKRDEASKNSRQMRRDIRTETNNNYEVKANAGYIRAALYINNESVNMPVKLRDILCSLMLESPDGQLLPVQSFRLRNDDFSIFEIDLYGDSTFGPYVIELSGLNTAEIMEALDKGYNPKIYIVDYEMTHVADSNYRQALSSNFTGDNLKIIEENAKGRTAGIKIVGPNSREFYRVVAFDTNGNESRTSDGGATTVSPGVPLEKALKRISFSGREMEFANYVLDFTGVDPEMRIQKRDGTYYDGPRFFMRGVKRVGGVEGSLPVLKTIEETDGSKTYIMKPITQWTDDDYENCKIWVIFDKGRYYFHAGDLLENGLQKEYEYTDNEGIARTVPEVFGIKGTIWPGDHYDLVYLDLAEYLSLKQEFGNNPVETHETVKINTRWNYSDLGDYKFYPDVKSVYLGQVGLGDVVEFKFKLDSTHYLNPNFGTPSLISGTEIYDSFSYNFAKSSKKFSLDEALDFEISYGLGGEYGDWFNLNELRSPFSAYNDDFEIVDTNWDFLSQEFTVLLRVPLELNGVSDDEPVRLYMRPALNSAYRESIWPLNFQEVKKFRGILASPAVKDSNSIQVVYHSGNTAPDDTIIIRNGTAVSQYTVQSVQPGNNPSLCEIVLTTALSEDHRRGEAVYVGFSSGEQPIEQEVRLAADSGFFADWNYYYNAVPDDPETPGFVGLLGSNGETASPAKYLGFNADYMVANWIGSNNYGNPYWNNWSDAYGYSGFLMRGFDPMLQTPSVKMLRLLAPSVQIQGDDKIINVTTPNSQESPQVAVSGNRALAVWKSVEGSYTVIRGRVVDITDGLPFSSDFLISSASTNNSYPQVVISGNRALVTWTDVTAISIPQYIYGRIINIDSCLPSGSIISISTRTMLWYTPASSIGLAGNKAVVTWASYVSGSPHNYYIDLRVIDLSSGSFLGGLINLQQNTTIMGYHPKVSTAGDKAIVVWAAGANSGTVPDLIENPDIVGRVVDISSGSPVAAGNVFAISTVNNNRQYYPVVASDNSGAIVAWQSNDNGSNYDIRARTVDLTALAPVGASDVLVCSQNNYDQLSPRVTVFNGKALVVWQSNNGYNNDICGRMMDVVTGNPLGSSEFLLSSSNTNDQINPEVKASGNRAFVVWQSKDHPENFDIRYRTVNMESGLPLGFGDYLLCTSYGGDQTLPQVGIDGEKVFTAWQSTDSSATGPDIRGRLITGLSVLDGQALPHGLSNFFVSPLIERDYSVTVKIKE